MTTFGVFVLFLASMTLCVRDAASAVLCAVQFTGLLLIMAGSAA